MMNDNDTIAAISTPLGEGGIGIIRLSGRDSVRIAEKIFLSPKGRKLSDAGSHRLIYGFIKDPAADTKIDEVLVAVMKAPNTYTKEDLVEINCHSGFLTLRKVLGLVLSHGARPAEPGEFTRRAFLNGRLDLLQAEAVMDLIKAKTEESGRAALEQLSGGLSETITAFRDRIASVCVHLEAYLDFPDDDIAPSSMESMASEIQDIRGKLSALSGSFEEGHFLRDGIRVAIVGRPNVGKSSLLNALLERDRAIVTEFPGTTRDVLEEYLNIQGLTIRIMDTAGIRETSETAEKEGVKRSLRVIDEADLVIGIIDGSAFLNELDNEVLGRIKNRKNIIAVNKSDLPVAGPDIEPYLRSYSENIIRLSAKTGIGLDILKNKIPEVSLAGRQKTQNRSLFSEKGGAIVTNLRHKIALDDAGRALERAGDALESGQPFEFVSIEMREGLDRLGEIVGAVAPEDILNRIFSEFCIGK